MASDSHNIRLGGVKQELQDLKKDASSSLADFKASIDTKFDVINNHFMLSVADLGYIESVGLTNIFFVYNIF